MIPPRDYLAIYKAALLKAQIEGNEDEVAFAVKEATNAALQDAADNCVEINFKRQLQSMLK